VISILLGYDQIHTNVKFVHVPIVPLEERQGVERPVPLRILECQGIVPHNHTQRLEDINTAQAIPSCAG
jgi:hypothetical protein